MEFEKLNEMPTPWLLAATPQLMDPNFQQAVLLMLEFNQEGAIGFVINNRSDKSLKEVMIVEDLEVPTDVPVWYGGPVSLNTGLVLHNNRSLDGEREIAPGVVLSASHRTLEWVVNQESAQKGVLFPYRLLVGYSGWGPGQLDSEIKQGAWVQVPLDYDILFNVDPNHIWNKTLGKIGITHSERFITPPSGWLN